MQDIPGLASLNCLPIIYHSAGQSDHPWTHRPNWEGIRDIALEYPELSIIVVFTGMLEGRRIYPILAQCPNVSFDLTCAAFGFIEDVVARYGPERIVCASHLPTDDPGLVTTMISYSGISDSAKQHIAYGNIERLIRRAKQVAG